MAETNGAMDYHYECMFLVDSARYAADSEGVSQQLTQIVEKAGGTVVVGRPWQDGRLAYEIEGHRKGTHYLFLLRMPGGGVKDIARSVRLSDLVLRHLVIRHSESLFNAMAGALSPSAEIQRSLYDEAPEKRRRTEEAEERERERESVEVGAEEED